VRYSQTTWTTRLLGLLLCPLAGALIAVIRHLPGPSMATDFACGYAFGFVACLLLGIWLHVSAGHDLLGRPARDQLAERR
jgi:hypothetical protein